MVGDAGFTGKYFYDKTTDYNQKILEITQSGVKILCDKSSNICPELLELDSSLDHQNSDSLRRVASTLLDNANKPTREQTKESLVSDIESYLHFAIHDADTTGKYKDDDYERKPILGVREIAEKTFSAMQTKTQELNLENQHSRRA